MEPLPCSGTHRRQGETCNILVTTRERERQTERRGGEERGGGEVDWRVSWRLRVWSCTSVNLIDFMTDKTGDI